MRFRSTLVAAAMLGGGVLVFGGGAPALAEDASPSIVDNHEYLGAAAIEAEHGIRLIKGDGRLLFEPDCTKPDVIQVYSWVRPAQFCFRTTGRSGHVRMELPNTYGIRSNSYALAIVARVDGMTERVESPPNSWTGVGEGESETNGPATLLDLHSTQVNPPAGPASDWAYTFVAKVTFPERSCSGALVDAEWILTAKACFAGQNPAAATVIVGRTNLTSSAGQEVKVTTVVSHPDRDIALARLAARVSDASARPVPLAQTPPVVGEQLRAAGFGRTRTEWAPTALHVETFAVTAVAADTVALAGHIPAEAVTCKGDAGGPAVREAAGRLELVGLHHTSGQTGCFGETGTGTGGTETRADDLRSWVMAETLKHVSWAGQADRGPALHQSRSATGAWSGITTVNGYQSAVPAGAKDVASAGLPDGSAQLVIVGADDRVYHRTRSAAGVWSDFSKLVYRSEHSGGFVIREAIAKRVAIAGLPDGSAEVMIVAQNDWVEHRTRAADGTWTEFKPLNGLGTSAPALGKDVAIAGLPNGTAQVLIVGWDNKLYHRIRNANDTWNAFAPLNGYQTQNPASVKRVSIAGLPDNSSQVLIVAADDKIYHRARGATGTWTAFHPLNGYGTSAPAAARDVAIAGLANGSAQVLIVGWDNRAYHRIRNANSWTAFAPVVAAGTTSGAPAKQVSIGGLPDNSSQLLIVG